jgi:hypothetical protein
MRKFLVVAALLFSATAFAQSKLPALDKSPMDMSYYPAGYPLLKIQDKANEPLLARVIYSRPQKNGRSVFGELLEYGKVWRLGANEATELELYQNVKIGGTKVKKGRYTLFCIPEKDKWTIIVNKDTDTWGAFKYDEKKDLLRTTVNVEQNTEIAEAFSIMFEKGQGCFNLVIAWDNAKITLPIYQ